MRDVNEKLMTDAGFYHDIAWEGSFEDPSPLSYWMNNKGVEIYTYKNKKIKLSDLVECITQSVAKKVRHELISRVSEYSNLEKE